MILTIEDGIAYPSTSHTIIPVYLVRFLLVVLSFGLWFEICLIGKEITSFDIVSRNLTYHAFFCPQDVRFVNNNLINSVRLITVWKMVRQSMSRDRKTFLNTLNNLTFIKQ